MISIELNGFKELGLKLGRIARGEFEEEVAAEVEAVVKDYVSDAVHNVQALHIIDTGFLMGQIRYNPIGPMAYEIISGAKYSAYHEFGTITHVKIPQGLEEVAGKFKGRGIKKTGGLYPRPFFYPPLPKAREAMHNIPSTVFKRLVA